MRASRGAHARTNGRTVVHVRVGGMEEKAEKKRNKKSAGARAFVCARSRCASGRKKTGYTFACKRTWLKST